MYFRSAPLQKTPPSPRSTTARTLSSRAHRSPARRRSCAVSTSSELNRVAAIDRDEPTISVVAMRPGYVSSHAPQQMRGSGSPSGSASSRRPKPVSRMTAPACCSTATADDRGVAAQRMRAQRGQHRVGDVRPHADHAPCLRWRRAAGRCRAGPPRRAPRRVTGTAVSSSTMPTPAFAGHLVQRAATAAARRVLHRHDAVAARGERRADQPVDAARRPNAGRLRAPAPCRAAITAMP